MEDIHTYTDRYSAKYSLENLGYKNISKNLTLFRNNLLKECNAPKERSRLQLIISTAALCHTSHS